MLTENDIVQLLASHLKDKGYNISQSLKTKDKGIDIIAEMDNHMLYIEAKGETSSKINSKRYGKAFSKGQIKSHISRAILTSMILRDTPPCNRKMKIAMALPDNANHRDLVDKIFSSLKALEIKVFWVSRQNIVEQ